TTVRSRILAAAVAKCLIDFHGYFLARFLCKRKTLWVQRVFRFASLGVLYSAKLPPDRGRKVEPEIRGREGFHTLTIALYTMEGLCQGVVYN
ncbi:MAG: hypothetical protein AAB923_01500, partial [Patescibacteria group bacterium]